MSFEDCFDQRVLRVDQLDFVDYDHYIVSIIRGELAKCLKYFQPGLLAKIDPELKAFLGFVLWKYSLYRDGATVSQQMLEIQYKSLSDNGLFSKKQRVLYGLGMIAGEWLVGRSFEIKQAFSVLGNIGRKWCSIVDKALLFHRFFSLLNFIAFLQNGRYKSLLERFLGIYVVFSKRQSARQAYFEYMNEEILRKGLSEFLFCVLPLLNIPRLRNMLLRLMWRKQSCDATVGHGHDDGRLTVDVRCGVCGDLPTNIHQTQCAHIFCYICIKANAMSDPSFCCPVCGEAVYSQIEPVQV